MILAGLAAWLDATAAQAKDAALADPELTIPWCAKPPVIDGKRSPDEWRYAAAVSLFEWGPVRQEQPVFYVFRDRENLYVAMESVESSTNGLVARCSQHDSLRICGDDCVELMIAPGAGEDLQHFDFPAFYWVLNSIGTVWDCKFVPLSAEDHNSWEGGAEVAHSVDGTYWSCEVRIPLAAIRKELPQDGTVWRMNFDRTYYSYQYCAWKTGALNDGRVGGNVTFDRTAPAIRLLGTEALTADRLNLTLEVANGTERAQQVRLTLNCRGQSTRDQTPADVGKDQKEVTVQPGEVVEVSLGGGQELLKFNQLTLEVTDASGRRLMSAQREVNLPVPRYAKRRAPQVPLVYVFPRFLPSRERLAVEVDYTAWAKKTGYTGEPPKAEVRVFPKGRESAPPVLHGILTEFRDHRGVWRGSTRDLPEGDYVVQVKVVAGRGEVLVDYDDWFEKRIFDWMKRPRGVGDEVPELYRPLAVKGPAIDLWGRQYRCDAAGLPESVASQGKELLSRKAELLAEVDGRPVEVRVAEPFRVTDAKPAKVEGRSVLQAGDLKIQLQCLTEYDGFLLYRMTYGPGGKVNDVGRLSEAVRDGFGDPSYRQSSSPGQGPQQDRARIGRLRLKVPLAARYARFYSAAGDTQGVTVQAAVLPDRPGRVFDSLNTTRSVCCSPTFATLFWVGDYETCFCYAADSDQGWLIRDDAPAVEAHREGDDLVLWLNLVDKPWELAAPRTLEFAFQAGPTKALPEGWRGIQCGGDPADAPQTFSLVPSAGSGYTLAGGTHCIHPGTTPQQWQRSKEKIEQALAAGPTAVGGYHYWGHIPKGFAETRVFRGEWGIDKDTWETNDKPRDWEWKNRFYGENRDLCIILRVNPVPSYVDFITYAYDEALRHTALSGFYDDTGYPKAVYDEELDLGFVREDGRKVYSSGLWVYRERWKRAAYVNHIHRRPNFLWDSQHCHAHYMPAYGFIGVWAPCEHGYYNPFADRDNLGFYRSMERYVAYNPARQFGQPSMIGTSSPQSVAPDLARDTRCMMMLALLNDQDLGSFGTRDLRTVCRLRHARNVFRTWERDVQFAGYWSTPPWVQCDRAGVLTSLYRRPDGALFLVGNVGEKAAVATIEPDWGRLRLDSSALTAVDAESGELLPLRAGTSGRGFQIRVPRHDVRLVVVGPAGRYPVATTALGAALPMPKTILTDLSARFDGPELAPAWQKGLHEGTSWAGILDGRLCVQGNTYGYAHVRRGLGVDNVSVQCQVLSVPSGGMDAWGKSLFLIWPNGQYVQASPGASQGKFFYLVSGAGNRWGAAINKQPVAGWFPYCANWVKVRLTPEMILCCGSADGKTWSQDWEVKRGAAHAGAPQWLMLGNGSPGKEPLLQNVHPQHFSPARGTAVFFSDLVVGKE
jgi:hypothetical protein